MRFPFATPLRPLLPTLLAPALLLLLVALAALPPGAAALVQKFDTGEVVIETPAGERHRFQVEIARSGEERSQGLMFRQSLAPDAGMIFLYPRLQQAAMWMRNTLIPLDMIFIRPDGSIDRVHEMATPRSLETIASDGAVSMVLEIAGGRAAELGITADAKLTSWPE